MSLYNSFYGGRKGASFVLVKKYSSILAMSQDFGSANCSVNYDEYVLINTDSTNDHDNGKVFRRGYDVNSGRTIVDSGGVARYAYGAEYIGTIIGPRGKAPHLEIVSIDDPDLNRSSYSANDDVEFTDLENFQMVPGKSGNVYTDNISYKAVSVRNADSDDTMVKAGFKVPYLVTEWELSSASPYATAAVTEADTGNHPFYKKYLLTLPSGKHGKSFENLILVNYSTWMDSFPSDSKPTVKIAGTNDNYNPGASIETVLLYKEISYENNADGEITYYFLGNFKSIGTIVFEDDILKIKDTIGNTIGEVSFPYVNRVDYDAETSTMSYGVNGDDETLTPFTSNIKSINNVGLVPTPEEEEASDADAGKLAVFYKDGTRDVLTTTPFNVLENIGYDSSNGILSYKTLQDADTVNCQLHYINNMKFDQSTGTLGYQRNGESTWNTFGYILPYIKGVKIAGQDKSLFVQLNGTDIPSEINGLFPIYPGTQPSQVSYSNGWRYVGTVGYTQQPLLGYHYTYAELDDALSGIISSTGSDFQNIYNQTDGLTTWEITWNQTIPNKHTFICRTLNYILPTGLNLNNDDTLGQVVTIGNLEEQQEFFAFNYKKQAGTQTYLGWYYLGKIEEKSIDIGDGSESNLSVILVANNDICSITIDIDDAFGDTISYKNKMEHMKLEARYKNSFTIPAQTGYTLKFYFGENENKEDKTNDFATYWDASTGILDIPVGLITNDFTIEFNTQ